MQRNHTPPPVGASTAADWIDLVPKVELHCHADALLDLEIYDALAGLGEAPPLSRSALARTLPARSHAHWQSGYALLMDQALQPPEAHLPAIAAAHVARWRRENVHYAELMVSGLLFARADAGAVCDVFRELRATLDQATQGTLRVELLVAIGRGSLERAQQQVERILALHRAGLICGVALAGDYAKSSVQALTPALRRIKSAGLGLEIHAGETRGPECVWDALRHGEPDRIGHGISAFADPALVEAIRVRGIHLELCPTSNLRVGGVAAPELLPLARVLDAGIGFSLNTDDPGPFQCSMSSELRLAARVFDFDADDFAAIYANSRAAAFAGRGTPALPAAGAPSSRPP